jgi:hypothetical protein
LSYHWTYIPESYRHHYWEMLLDEDDDLDRRANPDQSSEVSVRRGDIPTPTAFPKAWTPRPSRPSQSSRPNGPPPNSPRDFVRNHGPVAVESTEVNTLEDRSLETTNPTLGRPYKAPTMIPP